MNYEEEITRIATDGGGVADLSSAAYQWLYEKACTGGECPIGVLKCRTGDIDTWMDENLLPDYDASGTVQHLAPDECPSGQGPTRPQQHGEVIAGKWFSDRDIARAELARDIAKGN